MLPATGSVMESRGLWISLVVLITLTSQGLTKPDLGTTQAATQADAIYQRAKQAYAADNCPAAINYLTNYVSLNYDQVVSSGRIAAIYSAIGWCATYLEKKQQAYNRAPTAQGDAVLGMFRGVVGSLNTFGDALQESKQRLP